MRIFFTVCKRLFFLLLVSAPLIGAADVGIYKWRDGAGRLHFANSIGMVPREYREGLEEQKYTPPPPSTVSAETGSDARPGKEKTPPVITQQISAPKGSAPIHLNDANFRREVLNSDTPVMVDFWAVWCGPCRRMAPKVEALSFEYGAQVKVGKYDVDESEEYSARYRITGIPTLILFKNGRELRRIVGGYSKKAIKRFMGVDAKR